MNDKISKRIAILLEDAEECLSSGDFMEASMAFETVLDLDQSNLRSNLGMIAVENRWTSIDSCKDNIEIVKQSKYYDFIKDSEECASFFKKEEKDPVKDRSLTMAKRLLAKGDMDSLEAAQSMLEELEGYGDSEYLLKEALLRIQSLKKPQKQTTTKPTPVVMDEPNEFDIFESSTSGESFGYPENTPETNAESESFDLFGGGSEETENSESSFSLFDDDATQQGFEPSGNASPFDEMEEPEQKPVTKKKTASPSTRKETSFEEESFDLFGSGTDGAEPDSSSFSLFDDEVPQQECETSGNASPFDDVEEPKKKPAAKKKKHLTSNDSFDDSPAEDFPGLEYTSFVDEKGKGVPVSKKKPTGGINVFKYLCLGFVSSSAIVALCIIPVFIFNLQDEPYLGVFFSSFYDESIDVIIITWLRTLVALSAVIMGSVSIAKMLKATKDAEKHKRIIYVLIIVVMSIICLAMLFFLLCIKRGFFYHI